MFARHHYLGGSLAPTARCFAALWNKASVAFCATLPLIGRRDHWRITRLVVLPDYQGIGIGLRVAESVAELHRAEGRRINITASHPAVLAHCRRSPRWRLVQLRGSGSRPSRQFKNYNGSSSRPVASFEYVDQDAEPPSGTDAAKSPGGAKGNSPDRKVGEYTKEKDSEARRAGTFNQPALCRFSGPYVD
jgi:GNAT superfamily N-acetyltransferase